jgi:hypothetical protein
MTWIKIFGLYRSIQYTASGTGSLPGWDLELNFIAVYLHVDCHSTLNGVIIGFLKF